MFFFGCFVFVEKHHLVAWAILWRKKKHLYQKWMKTELCVFIYDKMSVVSYCVRISNHLKQILYRIECVQMVYVSLKECIYENEECVTKTTTDSNWIDSHMYLNTYYRARSLLSCFDLKVYVNFRHIKAFFFFVKRQVLC